MPLTQTEEKDQVEATATVRAHFVGQLTETFRNFLEYASLSDLLLMEHTLQVYNSDCSGRLEKNEALLPWAFAYHFTQIHSVLVPARVRGQKAA